jgi:colicin import membrane protein
MNIKHIIAVVVATIFALTAISVSAAEDPWFIIKDKNGVCRVIQAKEKTPATIAGPYETQKKADEAKGKECATAEKEAKIKAAEEAKAKADKEAKIKAAEEAKIKADKDARIKAEESAKLKAAEAEKKLREAQDAKIQADRDAKAKTKADEETKKLKDAKDAEKK